MCCNVLHMFFESSSATITLFHTYTRVAVCCSVLQHVALAFQCVARFLKEFKCNNDSVSNIYTRSYVHTYIHAQTCSDTCANVRMCTHTHTHTIQTHTHTHTHTHTLTSTSRANFILSLINLRTTSVNERAGLFVRVCEGGEGGAWCEYVSVCVGGEGHTCEREHVSRF